MKIKSVTIKNVKSFKEEVKIDFNDKINILIGANGGGKSNLLNIITIVIRQYFSSAYNVIDKGTPHKPMKYIKRRDIFENIHYFLDKFIGDFSESEMYFTFEITKADIHNIKTIKKNIKEFERASYKYKQDIIFNVIQDYIGLDTFGFKPGTISYFVRDNIIGLTEPVHLTMFYLDKYFKYLELFILLSKDLKGVKLHRTFLYFPPYRGVGVDNLSLGLSEDNNNLLMDYMRSTSKETTPLARLATTHFAEKRRFYESQGNLEKWKEDVEVKLVTKYLKKLGYDWNLNCIDLLKNIYEIVLIEGDREFSIEHASSGEKEIINFLLGIFAFNVKDGLIIVDEPELHLHPKWQSILMDLFIDLSEQSGNQFILSTHSPIFINPKTISSVIRVYKEDNSSNTSKIEEDDLKSAKELLHIVNSHNNEKMFFADKIVLVEGISDKLIFNKLIESYSESSQVIEVLEVHGKHNLLKYRNFLEKMKIDNFIIADFDYLFNYLSKSKKKYNMPKNIMKKAIKKRESFTEEENKLIDSFIENIKEEGVFILKKGDLEDYLSEDYKSKDLEKVINLVKDENFQQWFEMNDKTTVEEIESIIYKIIT